jgi:molybdate transport system substrate-binding protein
MTRFAALFTLFVSVLSPAEAQQRTITVFAAASLSGTLDEIAAGFDATVQLSFGGSGTMARQIAAGAPADVVILASPQWMDWLVQQAVLANGPPETVAQNSLVLIGPAGAKPFDSLTDFQSRLGNGRLAMGQRDAVPAGIYAQQWLRAAGLWTDVETRLAETDNVRAALALVARGEAPLGVVYATDAQAEDRVRILWTIPADQHDPILYPAAAVTPEGAAFLTYLTGPEAAKILARHGFDPVAK